MVDLDEFDMLYGNPMAAISNCLRAFLIAAPGHDLIAADYNAIEARGLAWLAGQEDDLNVFREGEDIYLKAATDIYGRTITKDDEAERQVGKVSTLALGYQGGVGAFQQMARGYGVKVSDDQADEIKVAWRDSHPEVVRYWWDLENAAIKAVQNPKTVYRAGAPGRQVGYIKKGSFLLCRLPSGRRLGYAYPRIVDKEVPWGGTKPAIEFKGVDSVTKQWTDIDTYGGKLCENITQAVCRDLLAHAIMTLERAGYPVVLHVHDEIVCEVPTNGPQTKDEMEQLMCDLPDWAEGFPVKAKGWIGKRYRK